MLSITVLQINHTRSFHEWYRFGLDIFIFSASFTNKLLFMLPSLHGQPKTLCLEVLANRVSHIPNIFLEMKSKGIVELLTHR